MIGKTIKSIMAGNVALTALVPATRMFPYVMNEGTDLPAIVYTIDSISPDYNKGGWATDDVKFSVHSFDKAYADLQSIVSAVRTALEGSRTGAGTQEIGRIDLESFDEGYDHSADVYFNKLGFTVIVNKY
jgi:hypothetical protein